MKYNEQQELLVEIQGIKSKNCISKIQHKLQENDLIFFVGFGDQKKQILILHETDPKQIIKSIEQLGYSAKVVALENSKIQSEDLVN